MDKLAEYLKEVSEYLEKVAMNLSQMRPELDDLDKKRVDPVMIAVGAAIQVISEQVVN